MLSRVSAVAGRQAFYFLSFMLVNLFVWPERVFANCNLNKIAELPVTMSGSAPIVAGKINDVEVKFVLSSGSTKSVISAASASQFNLHTRPDLRQTVVSGIGGKSEARIAYVDDFSVAGSSLHNLEFLVGGSEAPQGAAGQLGQNVLGLGDVEYDLSSGIVRLMRPEGCGRSMLAYWAAVGQAYSVVDLESIRKLSSTTLSDVFINGVRMRAIFATASSMSMISTQAAERVGIKIDSPDVVAAGEIYGIGPGLIKTYIARFSSFKIGDEEIRNVKIHIADFRIDYVDMLLGADFFLAHRIYVANSQQKMYLTYNGGSVFDLSKRQVIAENEKPSEQAPADAAGFSLRGAGYAARRDYDHALADLNRACELAPNNPEYFYQRGVLYWQHGQTVRALDDFYRALELKPDHVLALKARADIHSGRKDLASAKVDLDSADQRASKEADVRLALAQSYERLGYLDSALSQYDLWIAWHADDPRLAQALNGRCWTRASLNQDLAKALIDCNKALKLTGPSSSLTRHVLASRGLVLLRTGEYEKSIADYTASLKLEFKNAAALYGRGVDKIRLGKTEEGQADITEATWQWPRVADQFTERGITP